MKAVMLFHYQTSMNARITMAAVQLMHNVSTLLVELERVLAMLVTLAMVLLAQVSNRFMFPFVYHLCKVASDKTVAMQMSF